MTYTRKLSHTHSFIIVLSFSSGCTHTKTHEDKSPITCGSVVVSIVIVYFFLYNVDLAIKTTSRQRYSDTRRSNREREREQQTGEKFTNVFCFGLFQIIACANAWIACSLIWFQYKSPFEIRTHEIRSVDRRLLLSKIVGSINDHCDYDHSLLYIDSHVAEDAAGFGSSIDKPCNLHSKCVVVSMYTALSLIALVKW